jgi:hypothetical protein
MRNVEEANADQVRRALRDDEINAVTGGLSDRFARYADITGEAADAVMTTPSPPSPLPIPYPNRIA